MVNILQPGTGKCTVQYII